MRKGISKEDYQKFQDEKYDKDQLAYFNESLNKFKEDILGFVKRLEEIEASYGSFSSYTEVVIQEMDHKLNNIIESLRGKIGDAFLEMSVHRNKLKQLEDHVSTHYETKDDANFEGRCLWTEFERLENMVNSFKNELSSHITATGIGFDRKLELTKDDILSTPTELPNVKKELQEKIDLININSSNHLIRAENNERQIHILEKKIEQIFLLFKRNKLSLD